MTDDVDQTVEDGDDFDPKKPLKKSAGYLKLIKDYEKAGYRSYSDHADNIDKRYADLERLANTARDREFAIFWANIQVLGPSIYSRPPVPVVIPRFRADRKPIPRVASELLERCATVGFELEDLDGVMRSVRDDLSILSRGCSWVRYEARSKDNNFVERFCIEHTNRKDFAHDPARTWKEVDWAAKRSWMTKTEMRKRFRKTSGKAYLDAAFAIRRDEQDNTDGKLKAGVWELWSKSANRVVWFTEGVEVLLDDDEPHLKLEGFFPCPKPAYGTTQRNSLVPVPDYVQYKDQLEEINELTRRISALAESVKVKGFYPAGASDIGDAIEAAIKSLDNRQILVPVSNWAAFGDLGTSEPIIWLPIEIIGNVIVQLVTLRRQLIQDVYEITGLSDIMRGSTDANETLGAQELKSQYGSVRIRDRQDEMVRVARDLTRIACEIMAENFQKKTLLEMSQLDIAEDADIKKQVSALEKQIKGIEAQIKEAQSDPEIQAQAQQKPEVAQKILQQAQGQIEQLAQQIKQLNETVTIEKVMSLLREQKIRPFTLDIETDSTITPDENAQKKRATEFTTAVGGILAQAVPAVKEVPQIAPLMAETLKYVASQFRAGRQLDAVIDEFAEQMKQIASQPQANPEADAAQKTAQADMQAKALDAKIKQDTFARDTDIKGKLADHDAKMRSYEATEKVKAIQVESQLRAEKHAQDMELGRLDVEKKRLEVAKLGGQIDAQGQAAEIHAAEAAQRMTERAMEPVGAEE
ncbi:hypothetical protein [Neorhizobium galegae]|uniref:hypothetical protein n=1 Tax=Neorhizobium galegae TaxID=399 RepID=UPI000621D728|nr:hypothetical protein [Neorhizobium galegae]CDZ50410.1 Mll0462 protein [Neorhizobium galegae bv. orientalis]